MAATVKKYEFTISAKVGSVWKVVARYSASKASLPQSIAAFYKFFEGWKVGSVDYRFDCYVRGSVVWSDSYISVLDSNVEDCL